MESLTLPQIVEAAFGLLGAAVGVMVIILALRIAPALSLFAHQRALRIVVGAAVLVGSFVGNAVKRASHNVLIVLSPATMATV